MCLVASLVARDARRANKLLIVSPSIWRSRELGAGVSGFHVNWTVARKILWRSYGEGYVMDPHEIVTSIHSALSWNKFHGPIDMVTDDEGAAWLEDSGLAELYRFIDVDTLASVDPKVYDPSVYPTLAKWLGPKCFDSPVAILDTDFYLKKPVVGLGHEDFIFTHLETVGNFLYPPATLIPDVNGAIDPEWDFTLPAANTSFAYFGSNLHRESFVQKALQYSRCNNEESELDYWVRPLFAEQRISIFEARRLGISYRPLIDAAWSPTERKWSRPVPDDVYHHTWGAADRIVSDRDFDFGRSFVSFELAELLRRFPNARRLIRNLMKRRLLDFA